MTKKLTVELLTAAGYTEEVANAIVKLQQGDATPKPVIYKAKMTDEQLAEVKELFPDIEFWKASMNTEEKAAFKVSHPKPVKKAKAAKPVAKATKPAKRAAKQDEIPF